MRLRDLEAGRTTLGYLEGIVMSKSYLLCPNCLARHFRSAVAHDGLAERLAELINQPRLRRRSGGRPSGARPEIRRKQGISLLGRRLTQTDTPSCVALPAALCAAPRQTGSLSAL